MILYVMHVIIPGCLFILQCVTSQDFIPCNHTLIIDVIKGLNPVGINSIIFTSNSKIRSEFNFSLDFC
jgi:hypothetical protein